MAEARDMMSLDLKDILFVVDVFIQSVKGFVLTVLFISAPVRHRSTL